MAADVPACRSQKGVGMGAVGVNSDLRDVPRKRFMH
jgi:hypothetical protein